jgi:chemotaxis protein histidine kinase CheA
MTQTLSPAERAARVDFLREEADGLQILWKKGENYFSSFYATLERLKPQITDELLDEWCFWNLGMGLKTLNRIATILDDADRDRIQEMTKRATQHMQEKERAERATRKAERDAEQAAKETAQRQQEAAAVAEREAAAQAEQRQRDLATASLSRGRSKINENPDLLNEIKLRFITNKPLRKKELGERFKAGKNTVDAAVERVRGELLAERTALGAPAEPPKPARAKPARAPQPRKPRAAKPKKDADPLAVLAKEMRARFEQAMRGLKMMEHGRDEWAQGTCCLARKLREARERFPANQEFSAWLAANGLGEDVLSYNDRAALIHMGEHPEQMFNVLEETHRWSWQHIWDKELKPRLHQVMKTTDAAEPVPALH